MFDGLRSRLLGCSCESPCSDVVVPDEHSNVLQSIIDGSKYIASSPSHVPSDGKADIMTDRSKSLRNDPSWEANSDARLHPDAIAKVGIFLIHYSGARLI